jgi:hypothetical protein
MVVEGTAAILAFVLVKSMNVSGLTRRVPRARPEGSARRRSVLHILASLGEQCLDAAHVERFVREGLLLCAPVDCQGGSVPLQAAQVLRRQRDAGVGDPVNMPPFADGEPWRVPFVMCIIVGDALLARVSMFGEPGSDGNVVEPPETTRGLDAPDLLLLLFRGVIDAELSWLVANPPAADAMCAATSSVPRKTLAMNSELTSRQNCAYSIASSPVKVCNLYLAAVSHNDSSNSPMLKTLVLGHEVLHV